MFLISSCSSLDAQLRTIKTVIIIFNIRCLYLGNIKFSMRLVYAHTYKFPKKCRFKASNYRIFLFGRKFEVDLRMINKFNRMNLDL